MPGRHRQNTPRLNGELRNHTGRNLMKFNVSKLINSNYLFVLEHKCVQTRILEYTDLRFFSLLKRRSCLNCSNFSCYSSNNSNSSSNSLTVCKLGKAKLSMFGWSSMCARRSPDVARCLKRHRKTFRKSFSRCSNEAADDRRYTWA